LTTNRTYLLAYYENNDIRMTLNRRAASTLGHKARHLKRSSEPNVNDPCDGCLISSACTVWCDEKKMYLWE